MSSLANGVRVKDRSALTCSMFFGQFVDGHAVGDRRRTEYD
jgi:hypothetical protein